MRLHSFTALVTVDPAAPEDAARCHSDGTLNGCLLEPSCYTYFPGPRSDARRRQRRGRPIGDRGQCRLRGQPHPFWESEHHPERARLTPSGQRLSRCFRPRPGLLTDVADEPGHVGHEPADGRAGVDADHDLAVGVEDEPGGLGVGRVGADDDRVSMAFSGPSLLPGDSSQTNLL
jgi:hypothetical protein